MTTIERAGLTDQETILEFLQKQFEEHEIEYSSDTLSIAIEEILKREGLGIFFVARGHDKTIGIAAISFARTLEHGWKSAWLDELYVMPEYREGNRQRADRSHNQYTGKNEGTIQLSIKSKANEAIDTKEIEKCLEYTKNKVSK